MVDGLWCLPVVWSWAKAGSVSEQKGEGLGKHATMRELLSRKCYRTLGSLPMDERRQSHLGPIRGSSGCSFSIKESTIICLELEETLQAILPHLTD